MKILLSTVLVLVLAGCGGSDPGALQGYAEGDYVRVAAPFAGTLVQLNVARGTSVASGAPLFALEQENEAAGRREAEDRVKQAEAQRDNLTKGVRPSEMDALKAQLAQAQANAALAVKEYARAEDLVKKGFLSPQKLDETRAARDATAQRVREAEAQIVTGNLGGRPDQVRAAESEVRAAKAALDQADWRLRQKTVASTVNGIVTDTNFVQGEWVAAGAPIVAILPPENVKVRFFVPETLAGGLQPGRKVVLRCDGCPGELPATVSFIASEAEYTPPIIYSNETRAKLVFMVEARPAADAAQRLRPGQPVTVTLQ